MDELRTKFLRAKKYWDTVCSQDVNMEEDLSGSLEK
jgi:hypothetical protein